jgi:predicted ATP-binding protein involved in virulence
VLLQAIANLKFRATMELQSALDGGDPKKEGLCGRLVRVLESSVTQVTGQPFRFVVDTYPFCLRVKWGNGILPFDVLPDGLRSILGWLVHALVMSEVWLQGKEDPQQTEAIFLLDEIESHLHPAWQRKILPAFQRIFPKAQIFVATHSPFVIASLNHGWIHPITLNNDGLAQFETPISPSKGQSYITVVEDIMGVKEWYDTETEARLTEFRAARDEAFKGDKDARHKAYALANEIGRRSTELDYMMGREVLQMDRHISKTPEPK